VIERIFIYLIATVVLTSILAADLPRVTPSLVALGVLGLVARAVWLFTR
jgi:hypothetical protein